MGFEHGKFSVGYRVEAVKRSPEPQRSDRFVDESHRTSLGWFP